MDSNNPPLRGIITLTSRDSTTLEVLEQRTYYNDITTGGFIAHLVAGKPRSELLDRVWISEESLPPGSRAFTEIFRIDPNATTGQNQSTTSIQTDDDTVAYNVTSRFTPPSSLRTIKMIGLSGGTVRAGTVAVLGTPYDQDTNNTVDITYQVIISTQDTNGDLPTANKYNLTLARHIRSQYEDLPGDRPSFGDPAFPNTVSYMFSQVPPNDGIDWGTPSSTQRGLTSDNRLYYDQYKRVFVTELGLDDANGTIIRSLMIGGVYSIFRPLSITSRGSIWVPFLTDGSPQKPVQNLHAHRVDDTSWSYDSATLATSQGDIQLDATNWVQIDYPQFWRIDHHGTGNTASTNYSIRTRALLGFDDSDYTIVPNTTKVFSYHQWTPTRKSVETLHGWDDPSNIAEYDNQTVIYWDKTGLTVTNFNNTDSSLSFDINTSPSLPATDIQQIAVDDIGTIWVACASTGLYQIQDPIDNPVITLVTSGIPNNQAYGVAIGFDNTIWALVNGGLVTSSNDGQNIGMFQTDTFTYTGISDNLWSSVKYIRVDKSSPDNELALIHNNGTVGNESIVWYSQTLSPTPGPQSSETGDHLYGKCNVSERGHFWIYSNFNPYGSSADRNKLDANRIFFGKSTQGDLIGSAAGTSSFMYDYYGVPYVIGQRNGNSVADGWVDATNRLTPRLPEVYGVTAGEAGSVFSMQGTDGSVLLQVPRGGISGSQQPLSDFITQPTVNDPLNVQYSPLEEIMWLKYHWTGTTWDNRYFADAVDTGNSNTQTAGKRHNFDTEDHRFTGRSLIDVSDVFVNNAFTSNLTVALKYDRDDKVGVAERTQEQHQTLFSLFDGNQHVAIYLHTDVQNIVVVESVNGGDPTFTTLGTSPSIGGFVNIAVTLSGGVIEVHVNGARHGNSVTLTQTPDLSSPIMYIGCSVFPDIWSTQQVTQRITPQPSSFFIGDIRNCQICSKKWSASEITNHNNNPDAKYAEQTDGPFASVQPVARYELTQPLAGLETKQTHNASESLIDNVNISFADGSTGDSFVDGEYHTVGIVDGLLKDTATSLRHEFSMYYKPTVVSTDIVNGDDTNTVSDNTNVQLTSIAKFVNRGSSKPSDIKYSNVTTTNNGIGTSSPSLIAIPGQLAFNSTHSDTDEHTDVIENPHGAIVGIPITNDGWFEFQIGSILAANVVIGLSNSTLDNIHVVTGGRFTHGYKFNTDGTIDVVENGSVTAPTLTNIGTFTNTDRFRIDRTGTTVTLVNVTGSSNIIHTSSKSSSGTTHIRISTAQQTFITNCLINYSLPPNVMLLGNQQNASGVFDEHFLAVDTTIPDATSISIDSVDAPITTYDDLFIDMPTPQPGEVTINGRLGWVLFNTADSGSTVTSSVMTIYDEV